MAAEQAKCCNREHSVRRQAEGFLKERPAQESEELQDS
jgi:hypothetical protein